MPGAVSLVPEVEYGCEITVGILGAVMPKMIFRLNDGPRENPPEHRISGQVEMRMSPKIDERPKRGKDEKRSRVFG